MGDEKLHLFGEFVLDRARGTLLRAGQPVHLRPQAYKTLKYLVENSGRLISKDQLIEQVWEGRAVTDDSLVQCLRDVRHALGEGGNQYLRNERGRGYIFDPKVGEWSEQIDMVKVVVEEEEELAERGQDVARDELASDADNTPDRRPMHTLERVPATLTSDASESLTGVKETTVSQQASRNQTRRPSWMLATLLVVPLGIAAVFTYRYYGPAETRIESIAVLPFINESGNADLDYLSDGMTETLINNLSKLPNLTVKARSSVFPFKGKTIEHQQVANSLSVQALLEGRVVQRGQDLTLYLSLVDGRNGDQLWGEQYSRKLTDLLALQHEIARDVSRKLGARLSGADERRVTQGSTTNVEAYQLFLRGRFHVEKYTPQDARKALAYFQQAIALDPNFAAAYANLAGVYLALAGANDFRSRETKLKAKENALKAISLDDQLSTAHEALGVILYKYDYDFGAAEREYQRALELDPNDASAHETYGELLSHHGRHEEALAETLRAAEINPLSQSISHSTGMALLDARRYDEAIAQFKKTLELDAYFIPSHSGLAIAYQSQRNYAESVEERAKIAEILGNRQGAAFVRESFAAGGWQGFLRAMTENSQAPQVPPYIKATMYAELGDKNKAFEILNKLYEERSSTILAIKVDPRVDNLRSDPRFQDLMRRVGLTP
ncbi:MAG TPA: tetratricopeptide repeat protein [Pyrinomonadaceae bacterium]|nr:tetratricopeptide repeat protein [Pyrinomonadaceae bacterium]